MNIGWNTFFICYLFLSYAVLFLLSGLNLKCDKESMDFIAKKVKNIFVPYIVLCILDFIVMCLRDGEAYVGSINFVDTMLMTVESSFGKFWFLVVFLISVFIVYFMERKILNSKIKIISIAFMPIINRIFYYNNIYLPLSLEVCLLAVPFLYLGYVLKEKIKPSTKILCFGGAVYIIVFVIHILLDYPIISVYGSKFSNVLLYVLEGFSASLVVMMGVQKVVQYKKLGKVWKIFASVGKESLYIYGLHYYFVDIWLKDVARKMDYFTKTEKYVYDVLGMIFAIISSFVSIKIARWIKQCCIRKRVRRIE